MSDTQKFEAFKKNLIEQNEQKYGAEVRERWGDDAADSGDAAVEQHEKTGRQADQHAAGQGSEIGVHHQTAPSSTSSGIFR